MRLTFEHTTGVVTVAMLLGPGLSYYYFILLLGVGYSTTLWASHAFSNWGAVAMLCAPLAAALVLRFRARELADMPQRVAQHNLGIKMGTLIQKGSCVPRPDYYFLHE
jgi:1,4-dihydroxy-2-naphthoate octaprenyltransferase